MGGCGASSGRIVGTRRVSGLLDTSLIVRYLTGEPTPLAERAASVIDSDLTLYVTDVVLVETAHVLASVYGVSRPSLVDHLIAFVQKHNIVPLGHEKDTVLHALLMCRPSGRVSFPDAFTWATAKSMAEKVVYTLDQRFPGEGIELR